MAKDAPMNFADALSTRYQDIEKPPLPPLGTYDWQIKSQKMDKRGSYETVDFQVFAVRAHDDVDTDQLDAYGKLASITARVSFMFDFENEKTRAAQSLDRLKTFLGEHAKCFSEDQSLKEGIANSVGARFTGEGRYRPDKEDPTTMYFEIGRTAAIE